MKALARKLRDWLNGFLEEPGNSAVRPSQGPGDPEAAPAVLSSRDMPEHGALPASAEEEERNAFNQSGPPEDWLRRVREAAPGLLLSDEAVGVTRFKGRRPITGPGQPNRETASVPPTPGRSPKAFTPAQSFPGSEKKAWIQNLKRWVISHLGGRAQEEGFQLEGSSTAPAQARPDFAAGVRRPHGEQKASVDSRNRFVRSAAVTPRSTERVSHRIQAAASANLSKSMAPLTVMKAQKPNPPGASPPEVTETASEGRPTENRGPLQSAAALHRFEQSSRPGANDPTPPKQPRALADVPTVPLHSGSWLPLPTSGQDVPNRKRQSAETRRDGEQSTVRVDDWRGTQPADQWPMAADHSPKSESVDPWPELPDSQPVSTSEWRQGQRSAERLRELDIEQRGGR